MPHDLIGIKGIHIARYGGENDAYARVVVTVTLAGGQDIEVIDEYIDSAFSHHVSAEGIIAAARRKAGASAGRGR